MGDYQKARTYLEEGVKLARAEGDKRAEARCIGNLGCLYDYTEDYEKALQLHCKTGELFAELGDTAYVTVSQGNIGNSLFRLGKHEQALQTFNKALAGSQLMNNQPFKGWLLVQIGAALLKSTPADITEAEKHLLSGLQTLTEAGSTEGIETAHQTLSELYKQQGDFTKALEHYKAYAEFEIKKLKDLNEKRAQALSIQFEVEHLQQEQEIYQLKNVELARAVEKLEELSTRDSLTGLYNRRYLDNHLSKIFLAAQATKQPLAVLISDIDNFKAVNDNLSHATGDEVLKIVAQIFMDNTWGADVVARYGGEEFVIVFKETPLDEARRVAEKLRQKVESYPWDKLHPDLVVTLSTGLCADLSLGDHERMLSVSDDKLYEAKRKGKNQVVA